MRKARLRLLRQALEDGRLPKRYDVGFVGIAQIILNDAQRPMSCPEIIAAARTKGLLAGIGKTPRNTLYACLIRDMAKKGDRSDFRRETGGRFRIVNAGEVKSDEVAPPEGAPEPRTGTNRN
jgi:hypothetical protein